MNRDCINKTGLIQNEEVVFLPFEAMYVQFCLMKLLREVVLLRFSMVHSVRELKMWLKMVNLMRRCLEKRNKLRGPVSCCLGD